MTDVTIVNDTLLDDAIPKKFKNAQTGEVNVAALAQSYKALEQKMSSMPMPPSSADEYCIDCSHGLFAEDATINKKLFENGFTKEQAQFVYDLAAERLVPLVVEMANDFKAEKELEKLIDHFGSVEKWQEVSRQMLAYGQKNMPADVLDSLSSSYEGVLALYNMMNGTEPKVSGASSSNRGDLDLQSMMKDPKYWRDKDPSFVAKVTEGFQRLYGGK